MEVETGELEWEFPFPTSGRVPVGGVLSTAGDLVFVGDGHVFYVLDARTGEQLWTFDTGGQISAAPISFALDNNQHVTVAAGGSIFIFELGPA